ncbi:heme peroxidase [Mycena polygramma]|nr:heme peroxidase [Mycena polygramma]
MLNLAFLAYAGAATAYLWPSAKLDALEAQRWDQDDQFGGLASFIEPCDFFTFQDTDAATGRSNVPDWIRTAYHDMATHNVTDGTGGLDASIRFSDEQSRDENPGTGFQNTMEVFVDQSNRYVSMADLVAIGMITAIESCGGPQIAFRGGRVDAGVPNSPGVPEPQGDLDSHTAAFARQGFTPTEMIGLVACGHTFGGVEHKPFPQIVPELNEPNNTLSVAHFDTTFAHFDNNVATEYASGTTQNPLVVGLNDTTNSDKRIFASDGNVTMNAFAKSPELFASTCATLFARMLDTVPRDVQLTDVIEPLPVKPANIVFLLDGDSLKFSGLVRLFNQSDDPSRTVTLLWDDHTNTTSSNNSVVLQADHTSTAMGGRVQSSWYSFGQLSLDPAAGITTMRFDVNGKVEDQDGAGFALQDGVVFSSTSCLTSKNPLTGRFDIAVRNGLNPTRVFLEQEVKDAVDRTSVNETDITSPATGQGVAAGSGAYTLWSIDVNDGGEGSYTIGAEVGGVKYSTTDAHSLSDFDLPLCAPQRRIQHMRHAAVDGF